MKHSLIYAILIIVLCGISCQKAESVSPDFNCDKTTKIAKQTLGTLGIIFEYKNGKLSKVYRADGGGLTENYNYTSDTTITITRNFADGSIGNTFNVILTPQGYAKKFSLVDRQYGYTNQYSYDVNGFKTSLVSTYVDAKLNSNTVFSYTNGNLVQAKTFQNNVLQYTADYTYYEDKLSKGDLISNQNQPDLYGKFSKNLIKSIKYTYPDKSADLYEYTYEFNANGFVKSLIEKSTTAKGIIATQTNAYEYTCL